MRQGRQCDTPRYVGRDPPKRATQRARPRVISLVLYRIQGAVRCESCLSAGSTFPWRHDSTPSHAAPDPTGRVTDATHLVFLLRRRGVAGCSVAQRSSRIKFTASNWHTAITLGLYQPCTVLRKQCKDPATAFLNTVNFLTSQVMVKNLDFRFLSSLSKFESVRDWDSVKIHWISVNILEPLNFSKGAIKFNEF